MIKRNRPEITRFNAIHGDHGSTIYAAELSNGWIKVGFTRNPRSRLKSLRCETVRAFGCEILRYHIGKHLALRVATRAEIHLIHRMAEIATLAVPGRRELFSGTGFDAAKTLVDQTCELIGVEGAPEVPAEANA